MQITNLSPKHAATIYVKCLASTNISTALLFRLSWWRGVDNVPHTAVTTL